MSEIGYKKQGKSIGFRVNISLLLLLTLILNSITTQYLAKLLAYQEALLGKAVIGGFYWPWKWIEWSVQFWSTSVVTKAIVMMSFGMVVIFAIYGIGLVLISRRSSAVENLHGSAQWASEKEVLDSNLVGNEGVYIGGFTDKKKVVHYLRHNGPEHVLAFAPTRSGKGVGLVLPTLLSWPHSVLVYDIKGENFALTSGWRQKHANNLVMKFDPASTESDTVSFNPLEEMRLGGQEDVGDAQNIASMLVDPEGKGLDDHWSKSAHALLTACILHCCYEKLNEEGRPANLADVGKLLADPNRGVEEMLQHMLEYHHYKESGKTHEVVAQEAQAMSNKDPKEMGSVLSTAISFLTLYRDPIVAKNTHHSDFKIHDLMNNEKAISLYLVIRPSDAERVRPLIRLMITQVIRRLTEKMEFKNGQSKASYKHRLLLMLDEFPSLKRLKMVEDGLAFMAGYGLKAYLIVQDYQQLQAAYTKEEAIFSNCHVRIAYAPNNYHTAKLLSDMAGTTTVIKESRTRSGKSGALNQEGVSISDQEISRPLITPDETMRLPAPLKDNAGNVIKAGDMLIFIAGQNPIYGTQILYFKDPVFSARSKVECITQSDKIISTPSVDNPKPKSEGEANDAATEGEAPSSKASKVEFKLNRVDAKTGLKFG